MCSQCQWILGTGDISYITLHIENVNFNFRWKLIKSRQHEPRRVKSLLLELWLTFELRRKYHWMRQSNKVCTLSVTQGTQGTLPYRGDWGTMSPRGNQAPGSLGTLSHRADSCTVSHRPDQDTL